MKVLITGCDAPLGALLSNSLSTSGEVTPVGEAVNAAAELRDGDYVAADLGEPEEVQQLLVGVDAIVHAQPFAPSIAVGVDEAEILDRIARGTYVLATAAIESGIARMVLISNLNLLASYPEDYRLNTQFRPQPDADAEALAPFLAELTGREIARTGQLKVICLRMGTLDDPAGTSSVAAAEAVKGALADEMPRGYSWELRHISSDSRFG
jgi:nucleoside-diphosphate-sugar epimerase